MNLFVNGCSFTGGTEVIHNELSGKAEAVAPYFIWSNQLYNSIILPKYKDSSYINLAIGGNSNDKIVRTTLEYFSENNVPDNTLAIIQFTSIHRLEFFIESRNTYVNYCNTHNIHDKASYSLLDDSPMYKVLSNNILGYHFDYTSDIEWAETSKEVQRHHDTAERSLKFLMSATDLTNAFLHKVLLLQNFFKDRGIPVLFTTMSNSNHLGTLKAALDRQLIPSPPLYTKSMLDLVDTTKWNSTAMTILSSSNTISKDDAHPNAIGNKLIMKNIAKKLQQLEYI